MVVILLNTFKLNFSREIGQYCWTRFASWAFGSRVVNPKFRLNSSRSPTWRSWNISNYLWTEGFSKFLIKLNWITIIMSFHKPHH